MTDFSGRKTKYGIGVEAVRGTPVAATNWIRWETADFEDTATTILNQSAIGVLDKYSGAETVNTMGNGQLAGKITDQSVGYLLLATQGGYSKAAHAGETVVFDHTFSEGQANAAQTLTITRVDPNVTEWFAESMVNSFEVDVKAGDFVRHTTQFISQPSTTTTATPAFVNETEFIAKHVTVKFASTTGGLGAATAIPLATFKLTISKDTQPYFIIGQNNPSDIFAHDVEIKGEMMLRYTDSTYKALRFNNTVQAVQVDVKNTGVTIGNAASPEILFTMPTCYLNDWKVDQSIDGMVQQTITFEAVYSLSTAYALTTVLTNKINSYSPYVVS